MPPSPAIQPTATPSQRWLSRLLILTVSSLSLQPLTAAAQARLAQPTPVSRPAPSHLEAVEDAVKRIAPEAWPGRAPRAAGDDERAQAAQVILERADAIEAESDAALAEFRRTEAELEAKALPAEIVSRHRAAVAAFEARRAEYRRHRQGIEAAAGGRQNFLARAVGRQPQAADPAALKSALDGLAGFLARHPNKRPHTPSDPAKLPWGSPDPQIREPFTTPSQFQLSGLFPTVKLAAAGSLQGITLPAPAGAAPTEADLAETEEVQLTPEIRALAQELGNSPVKIHWWVRNHIEFVPSYGSIQGAALTLQTRRGNAFDTASLEIALLRAAGIHARYVYGTIELPAEKLMNWVGGVTRPEAAQSLLGQGGIPNVGIVAGGRISQLRMEHVWVEAWVDFFPSRGARHIQGDTWTPLDASFKQYEFKAGMDLKTQVPLDAQALLDQAKQGATVNEAEGWVQNLDQAGLQTALTDYQGRLKAYIDSQNPAATVGDVLGSKTVIAENFSILMGSLPYKTVATGSRFAAMPANLQWKFRTALYADGYGYLLGGSALASLSRSTPSLAGRKITLSFRPASQADIDLLNSYLPKPHADGSPIQPAELPASLPGYLLHLVPEIRVDGGIVGQGGTVTMGEALLQATAIWNPASQRWQEGEANRPIAGEYHALALDLQGTGQGQLTALKAKLAATKASLERFQAGDAGAIAGLTKEDLSGDLLYAGILGYFASVDAADQLAARSRGDVVAYRLPSYGAFSASAQPRYWFGIVRSVSFPGVAMDVDRLMYQAEAKDEDGAKRFAYMRQVGALSSAFEHAVPEQLFVDTASCNLPGSLNPDPAKPECAQGVSAVKALAIAAAQGQRIYTLNAANQASHGAVLAQIAIDAEAKAEIGNALAAGMEVTVHQADITVSAWTGAGYVILDPETGAGAYKIAGGANGAVLLLFLASLLAIVMLFFVGMVGIVSAGAILLILSPAFLLMGGALYMILNDPNTIALSDFLLYVSFFRVAAIIALAPFEGTFGAVIALLGAIAMLAVSMIKALLSAETNRHVRGTTYAQVFHFGQYRLVRHAA